MRDVSKPQDWLSKTQQARLAREAWESGAITIRVETKEIEKIGRRPEAIPCRIEFKTENTSLESILGYVACGHWRRFGTLKGTSIDLVEHLPLLLPERGGLKSNQIGLCTVQNGIQNTPKDFLKMVNSIVSELPELPLVLGLYNATAFSFCSVAGIDLELLRFENEPMKNHRSVFSLAILMKIMVAEIFPKHPNMKWAHFAHSEGGLIAHTVMDIFKPDISDPNQRKYIKDNLIIATYGAVRPVYNDLILLAMNTYSDQDIALSHFGKDYFDMDIDLIQKRPYTCSKEVQGKKYTVKLVKSKLDEIITPIRIPKHNSSSWRPGFRTKGDDFEELRVQYPIKDHGFLEISYQTALKGDIKELRNKHSFYYA